MAIESCSALVTADGATPSAYVYYQLDSRSSALSFGVRSIGYGGTLCKCVCSRAGFQDYMTRVVDAPPTADPVFDEVFAHELPPTVEVLDTLAQEPLMVMVFDASASSRDPSASASLIPPAAPHWLYLTLPLPSCWLFARRP
mgnify:CR=1 FL=1